MSPLTTGLFCDKSVPGREICNGELILAVERTGKNFLTKKKEEIQENRPSERPSLSRSLII